MRHVSLILTVLALTSTTSAQQEVVLDKVTNSIGDSLLIAGNTHVLDLCIRNFPVGACRSARFNPNNGFRVHSPDNATWNYTRGSATHAFINLHWTQYWVHHYNDLQRVPEGDGSNTNELNFSGVCFFTGCCCNMGAGFDSVAFQIEIRTNLSDTGLHICIDSTTEGTTGSWNWAAVSRPECSVAPAWSGPHCFKIVFLTCADVNTDGAIDHADLDFLLDYYFNFGPAPPVEVGDVNSDGVIDILDILFLAQYLNGNGPAPCGDPPRHNWKDESDQPGIGK